MYRIIRFIILKILDLRFLSKDWIKLGRNHTIYLTTQISRSCKSGGVISIGNDCRIGVRSRSYYMGYAPKTRLILWGEDSQIIIGDRCYLNGVNICARKRVTIGSDCLFAGGVQIADSNSHKVCAYPRAFIKDDPAQISIGNNVWVGLNAIILKGSQIGDNCVVGAGSVVKGIFPPNSVISGNPARVVREFELSV